MYNFLNIKTIAYRIVFYLMIYCRCAEVLHIHVFFSWSFSKILDKNKGKWMEGIAPPLLDSFSWELLITPRPKWFYLPCSSLFISLLFWQISEWSPWLGWIPSCTHPCTFSSATSPSVTSAIPQPSALRCWWTYLPRTSQSLSVAALCNSWSSVSLQILSVSCWQWWPMIDTGPSAAPCSMRSACPAGCAPCLWLGFTLWECQMLWSTRH